MATATGAVGAIVRCAGCGKQNRVRPISSGTPRCGSCHASLPWVVEAHPATFEAEVDASVPVIVDFWASWCGPCRMVAPALEGLAASHAGRLKVVKVNVDVCPELAARYGAQSIPLLLLMSGGEEVDRALGARPQAELERWLAPHLAG